MTVQVGNDNATKANLCLYNMMYGSIDLYNI